MQINLCNCNNLNNTEKKEIINMNLEDITCPIHSFESFGAVDGPGIRYVIFTKFTA